MSGALSFLFRVCLSKQWRQHEGSHEAGISHLCCCELSRTSDEQKTVDKKQHLPLNSALFCFLLQRAPLAQSKPFDDRQTHKNCQRCKVMSFNTEKKVLIKSPRSEGREWHCTSARHFWEPKHMHQAPSLWMEPRLVSACQSAAECHFNFKVSSLRCTPIQSPHVELEKLVTWPCPALGGQGTAVHGLRGENPPRHGRGKKRAWKLAFLGKPCAVSVVIR